MAYKDEYEVARLHSDPAFLACLSAQFEGDFRLEFHLAPPLLARRNARGELQKRRFGPAMLPVFRLLARLKGLRGGLLDPFGHTAERRQERALIAQYQQTVSEVLEALRTADEPRRAQLHAQGLELARLPEKIKGYGHVKERHLAAAQSEWVTLLARFRALRDTP